MKIREKITRRELLKNSWKVLGVVALAETAWMAVTMMASGTSGKKAVLASLKMAGKLNDIPPGSVLPYRSGLFYLIRLEDGGLMAISMTCTHLGCTVNWDSKQKNFICPCHASEFDALGNVIKSPASKALNYFPVIVENGQVYVDVNHLIQKRHFDKSVVTYV